MYSYGHLREDDIGGGRWRWEKRKVSILISAVMTFPLYNDPGKE
jgi:hypothetical protein